MSDWSVDLCRGWVRIGEVLDGDFAAVTRYLDAGDWTLAAAPEAATFGTYPDPSDVAAYQPGYMDFPGENGDNVTISRTALSSLATLEFRCRIRPGAIGGLYVLGGWGAGTAAAFLFNNNMYINVVNTVAAAIGNAASTVTVPGIAIGTDICLRFKVTISTATCEYWYSYQTPDRGDESLNLITWLPVGTPVVGSNAGTTPLLTSSSTPMVGDYVAAGGFPWLGRCYNWVEIDDASPPLVVDSSHDIVDTAATTFVTKTGQTATVNRSGSPATALVAATPIEIREWIPSDVDTIRLVQDNTLEFAGYVQPISDGAAGFEITRDGSGERWSWSGPDLWGGLLNSRVAYPSPGTEPAWASAKDTNTGVASTVLTNYLNDNMGSTALAARRITGFAVDDQLQGASSTWTARLQPLDELVKRICGDAALVCRIAVDFDGNITATVGLPRDLSERFVISDQGDLSMLKVRYEDARKTMVIAGGTGTGASRTFASSDSGATGEARRELFIDESSLDTTELAASAATTRWLNGASYSVYAELTDDAATELQYLRDYQIGDSVAVQVDNARFVVPITSVAFEVNAARQVIRPTLGTAVPDALKALLRRLSLVANRNSNSIS